VHTAEDDELCIRAGSSVSGKLERVSRYVCELDDFVTLIVVPKDEESLSQSGLGSARPLH
jgi:hypothetical protein